MAMDSSSLQNVKFGFHTEVWAGCVFLPKIHAYAAEDIHTTVARHPTHPVAYERSTWQRRTLCNGHLL